MPRSPRHFRSVVGGPPRRPLVSGLWSLYAAGAAQLVAQTTARRGSTNTTTSSTYRTQHRRNGVNLS